MSAFEDGGLSAIRLSLRVCLECWGFRGMESVLT